MAEAKTVRRYDAGTTLAAPVRLPNGYLRGEAFLSRIGVQEYRQADGSVRVELRLPEEVFAPESLASARAAPITDEHPPVPLDASNTREYQRGHLDGEVTQDGAVTRGVVLVTDAGLIAKMDAGEQQEVSLGYSCTVDDTPGTWTGPDGQTYRYDGVQRDIRVNHVAITRKARGGSTLRVRMDSGDAVSPALGEVTPGPSNEAPSNTNPPEGKRKMEMVQVVINGKTFGIPADAAAALAAEREEDAQELQAETAKADAAAARADSAERALKESEKQRNDSAANLPSMVSERVALVVRAMPLLGAALKMDSEPADIRRACVAKLAPSLKLDGKSADYVSALYDVEMARFEAKNGAARRDTSDVTPSGVVAKPVDELRADSEAASRNAWKKTAGLK